MTRLAALALLLLSGCCSGPSYMLLAYDERMELERLERFAIALPVIDDERTWAFGEPPEWVAAREAAYRPLPAADDARDQVLAVDQAPELLRRAHRAARAALLELGYRVAEPGSDPKQGFVVSLALSYDGAGRLVRLGLHAGSEQNARFEPHRLSLAAVLPSEEEACDASVEELVDALMAAIPPRSSEP